MDITHSATRERPHRLPRASYRGEVAVAFTARLARGSFPIDNAGVCGAVITALATAASRHACAVPVYCFMPDHVHLVLMGVTTASDTWKAMTAFKQRSGYWLSQYLPGTHWQKDFYDHVLLDDSELRAAMAYIAANPVRAGLVCELGEYPLTGSIGFAADHAG